jgi:hypothetical protein
MGRKSPRHPPIYPCDELVVRHFPRTAVRRERDRSHGRREPRPRWGRGRDDLFPLRVQRSLSSSPGMHRPLRGRRMPSLVCATRGRVARSYARVAGHGVLFSPNLLLLPGGPVRAIVGLTSPTSPTSPTSLTSPTSPTAFRARLFSSSEYPLPSFPR